MEFCGTARKEISENRVVRGGGSRGKNKGKIGESQQHQHSTAAPQQQPVSDTTTGRGRRKKYPRSGDRSSSSSSRVKIDGMSIRGTNRSLKGAHRSKNTRSLY